MSRWLTCISPYTEVAKRMLLLILSLNKRIVYDFG